MRENSSVPAKNKPAGTVTDSFKWEFLEKAGPALLIGLRVAVLLVIYSLQIHPIGWMKCKV
jgi:hypothetical protein